MTTELDAGIEDLGFVLGGGIVAFERIEGALPSATVLIRGPAGSGKTLLASHIAVGVARQLRADIAYACVELLPTELRAQLQRFGGAVADVNFALDHIDDSAQRDESKPTALVASLAIDRENPEPASLLDAVNAIAREASLTRAAVRVFVIDSLSVGYRLGPDTARHFCDELCKLAGQRGWVLILLEESDTSAPSSWSYAVDTVLQLRVEDHGQRTLQIPKHRFGEQAGGKHLLQLSDGACSVFPSLQSYSTPKQRERALPAELRSPRVLPQIGGVSMAAALGRDFRECTTAVWGSDSVSVAKIVRALCEAPLDERSRANSITLSVSAAGGFVLSAAHRSKAELRMELLPTLSAPQVVAETRAVFWACAAKGGVRQLVIGDLSVLQDFDRAAELRNAVQTLVALCRLRKVPVVLFETATPRRRFDGGWLKDTQTLPPLAGRVADVHVEICDTSSDAENTTSVVFIRDVVEQQMTSFLLNTRAKIAGELS